MTDRADTAVIDDGQYYCPGEPYAISRPLHLARLSAFYRGCRNCPHRFDREPLSPRTVQQLAALEQPTEASAAPCLETLGGRDGADFGPREARHLAAALGLWLREQSTQTSQPIQVAVAFDGRPLLAEYVAQVAEGLRWAGCGVIDLGVTTAPVLALEQAETAADGALYLGSPSGEAYTVGLKFWGAAGQPLSRGHGLETLEAIAEDLPPRPVRQHGPLVRRSPADAYTQRLQRSYHALRPLRFVLDTTSRPLQRSLDALLANVACRVLEPWPGDTPRGNHPGEAVLREQAHFGLWIDGDGEALRLWDEQGREVPWHAILAMLARHLLAARPAAAVAVEAGGSGEAQLLTAFCLDALHARRIEAGPTRAEMFAALAGTSAVAGETAPASQLGGGHSGRFWFSHRISSATDAAEHVYVPDGLEVLTQLLVLLSGSDRPLSSVAAESLTLSGYQ